MYQVNVNAEKIFGYNKGELQNKKVNDIMPHIYAVEHDKILENFHQTNYSTMINK
jgi:PAS domain S-box-containing protein